MADETAMVDRLIEQLQGKAQYYDGAGGKLGFFASWTTRHYEENTRIYAARLLCKKATPANQSKIVDALLEALKNGADDRDTGDGIIFNRSEITFALARISDEKAIRPLLQTLVGKNKIPMINYKGEPPQIKLGKTSSNLNIIRALGSFKGPEAENAALILEIIKDTPQDAEIEKELQDAIDRINNADFPEDLLMSPIR